MIRSIIVTILCLFFAGALSYYYVGYDRAGREYIDKQKEQRKSVRVGSPGYYPYGGGPYGSSGRRGGK